jgi:hypothetical protein
MERENKLIEAAKLLENHCRESQCDKCLFYHKLAGCIINKPSLWHLEACRRADND